MYFTPELFPPSCLNQWRVSHQCSVYLRGGVKHVDQDEAEGDQQDDPGRHDVGGDEERHLNIGIVNINITTGQLCSLCEIYLLFKYKIYIHFQAKVEVKFNLELADVGGSINIYFEIHCSPSRMVIQLF